MNFQMASAPSCRRAQTEIPARLDRLPWSRRHWLVVAGLGVTWLLDRLEVTLAGILKSPRTLGMSDAQVGLGAAADLLGAVGGALLFGRATDHYGRKKLFFITLAVYLTATAATAFSWGAGRYQQAFTRLPN